MNTEIWVNVVGFEGLYEVSNTGRVRSLSRTRVHSRNRNYVYTILGKELSNTYLVNSRYPMVRLRKDGKISALLIHRLVAEAFIPKVPGKDDVNHINKVITDNRVENLEWVNHRENISHAYLENSKSKHPGVSWIKSRSKWMASILIDKKRRNLGLFKTVDEAARAYANALKEHGLINQYS